MVLIFFFFFFFFLNTHYFFKHHSFITFIKYIYFNLYIYIYICILLLLSFFQKKKQKNQVHFPANKSSGNGHNRKDTDRISDDSLQNRLFIEDIWNEETVLIIRKRFFNIIL